jgi:tetratricopeptide (TPR) repeat protein
MELLASARSGARRWKNCISTVGQDEDALLEVIAGYQEALSQPLLRGELRGEAWLEIAAAHLCRHPPSFEDALNALDHMQIDGASSRRSSYLFGQLLRAQVCYSTSEHRDAIKILKELLIDMPSQVGKEQTVLVGLSPCICNHSLYTEIALCYEKLSETGKAAEFHLEAWKERKCPSENRMAPTPSVGIGLSPPAPASARVDGLERACTLSEIPNSADVRLQGRLWATDACTWADLGDQYARGGAFIPALLCIEKALSILPMEITASRIASASFDVLDLPRLQAHRAVCLKRLGRDEDAKEVAKTALSLSVLPSSASLTPISAIRRYVACCLCDPLVTAAVEREIESALVIMRVVQKAMWRRRVHHWGEQVLAAKAIQQMWRAIKDFRITLSWRRAAVRILLAAGSRDASLRLAAKTRADLRGTRGMKRMEAVRISQRTWRCAQAKSTAFKRRSSIIIIQSFFRATSSRHATQRWVRSGAPSASESVFHVGCLSRHLHLMDVGGAGGYRRPNFGIALDKLEATGDAGPESVDELFELSALALREQGRWLSPAVAPVHLMRSALDATTLVISSPSLREAGSVRLLGGDILECNQPSRLRSILCLRGQLGNAGIRVLSVAMQGGHLPQLCTLHLDSTGIQPEGLSCLSRALSRPGCGLQRFSIRNAGAGCSIGTAPIKFYTEPRCELFARWGQAWQMLFRCVQHLKSLEILDLCNCGLRDDNMADLAVAVQVARWLRVVKLNGNRISVKGLSMLLLAGCSKKMRMPALWARMQRPLLSLCSVESMLDDLFHRGLSAVAEVERHDGQGGTTLLERTDPDLDAVGEVEGKSSGMEERKEIKPVYEIMVSLFL